MSSWTTSQRREMPRASMIDAAFMENYVYLTLHVAICMGICMYDIAGDHTYTYHVCICIHNSFRTCVHGHVATITVFRTTSDRAREAYVFHHTCSLANTTNLASGNIVQYKTKRRKDCVQGYTGL